MTHLFADTDPRIEAMLIARLREMPAWRKLELMEQLNRMARTLALSDLHEQYPQASEAVLRRLADLLIGPKLAERVYGPLPESPNEAGL